MPSDLLTSYVQLTHLHIYYQKHSLNPKTGQPISVNSTFESIFGPIYKFKEWEFANAATGDDISPEDPGTKNIDVDESHPNINREKFREAIDTVRSSLSPSEDPSTSSEDDNGGDKKKESSTTKIRNVEMLTLGTNDAGLPVRKYFDWTIGSVNMQQPINCDDDNDDTTSHITSAVILYGDMVNEEESSDR